MYVYGSMHKLTQQVDACKHETAHTFIIIYMCDIYTQPPGLNMVW